MNNEIVQTSIFELAEKWVNETHRCIFLTGKAGTGKTTFLKHIKNTTHKNAVVLAPTGIAAINAEGSTLHSFFRLPFGTFIPTNDTISQDEKLITKTSLPSLIRYNKQHINLLRSLELIIIDEVSMVRADVLDMIDQILRRFRQAPTQAFGGTQILFIGDMHQLPPVVKEQEVKLLSQYYSSPYFFDSHVMQEIPPVIIQLEKVYRQQEDDFLTILNELRHNEVSLQTYEQLAAKITSVPPDDDSYITLTSHVAKADRMNALAMQKLTAPAITFHARIEGDFPPSNYPTPLELVLKTGARVMFIKNDPEKKYFNGKTGKIVAINDDVVTVLGDDGTTIDVSSLSWQNTKYATNADTGSVEEQIVGSFWQIPLRLAWAVTIHKSQGLTFDKVIIDAEKSFASGQVYVALSRCRTWDGIVLLSKINAQSLLTDIHIVQFHEKTWKQKALATQLPEHRYQYQTTKIVEAFDLKNWKPSAGQIEKTLAEYQPSFSADAIAYFQNLVSDIYRLATVSGRFVKQINELSQPDCLPEENIALIQRLQEAAQYFTTHNQQQILDAIRDLPEPPDNTLAANKVLKSLETLREKALSHQTIWATIQAGFSITNILKARAKGVQAIAQLKPLRWNANSPKNKSTDASGLYEELRWWRSETADAKNIPLYRVISNKAIDGIVAHIPLNRKELLSINGIGSVKVKEYGDEMLSILAKYHPLKEEEAIHFQEKKPDKKISLSDTYQETLLLYKSGMKLKAIATARNLTEGTIGGHFAILISQGVVAIDELLPKDKQQLIIKAVQQSEDDNYSLKTIKEKLNDEISWEEIKWVVADIKFKAGK